MFFSLFFLSAIAVIVLYYTGWLRNHNLEWIVYVFSIAVFPAMIYL